MRLLRLLPERISHIVTLAMILASLSAACSGQTNRFEAGISAKERGQYLTAIRSWLPLAEDGMPEAQVNLGHMYNEGLGVDVDYEEALYWYTLASESNQPEAVFNIGLLYLDGNAVEQNAATAIDYFERAESLDISAASYMIGTLQLSGDHGIPVDLEGGRERVRLAAIGGVPEAQFSYGNLLLSGLGAPRKLRGIFDFFFSDTAPVGDPFLSYIWGRIAQENDLLDSDLDRLVGVTEVMLDGRKDQAEEIIAECIASALTNCPSILRVE